MTDREQPTLAQVASDAYSAMLRGFPDGGGVLAALGRPGPCGTRRLDRDGHADRGVCRGPVRAEDAHVNVVELILQLGRWGQTHQTAVLTGVLATPLLLGG